MSDQFTEVTRSGFGSNILKSIVGAFVGFIVFLLAFPLLWWNEGRTNWADVAKTAKVAPADRADPALEGQLVSLTAALKSDEEVGDPEFLKPGPWIALTRHVEMFAWNEKKDSKEEKELGGSSKTTTRYTYTTVWTSSPDSSSSFKDPVGHENPTLSLKGHRACVGKASLGAWSFSPSDAELPTGERLPLSESKLLTPGAETAVTSALVRQSPAVESDYIFMGKGKLTSPVVGDVRVSFSALKRDANVTLFGKVAGATVVAYFTKSDERFFRALTGSRDEAIASLALEHAIITWVLRLVGFLMMWIGLSSVLSPIAALTDVIPALGSFGRFMISVITFPIAGGLATVTIVVSMILHSLVATIVAGVVMTLVVLGLLKVLKKRPAAA